MLNNPYLNYEEVLSYGMRHHFLVGDRGIGKTYGITKWLLKRAIYHNEPFIWTRNTKAAIEELTKFNAIGFLGEHIKKMNLEQADFTVTKSVLFYQDRILGAFLSLGNFFSIKGIDHNTVKNFVFDEFMPERREAHRVDYDYALKSIMQSVFRTRTDFRAFYTANVLAESADILNFFSFSITPTFPGQVKQINRKLVAIIFYLQNLKVSEEKEKTGDAFALANKYTESSLIIDYEKNINKECAQDMKKSEKMAYVAGDQTYFLLREFGGKVAIIPVKKMANASTLPCYALNKKFVFSEVIFDQKFKAQLLKIWNTNGFVFKSHYALYQFTQGLFMQ